MPVNKELDIPKLTAQSLDDLKAAECLQALESAGAVILSLAFPDPESRALLALASALGQPHPHSASGEILWDVRPSVASGLGPRSQTSLPFPLHTDCAFEDPTPRFIGLQVIRRDSKGGGVSLLVDGLQALELLAPGQRQTLTRDYLFRVPKEFYKGVWQARLPIVHQGALRYRREIIDESECSEEQLEALSRFEEILTQQARELSLDESSILLLDNRRFLHGRTEVLDPLRHLTRVRFHQSSEQG